MEPGFNTPQTSTDAKDAMLLLAKNSRTAESATGFAQAAGLFAIAAAIEALEMTMRGRLYNPEKSNG